MRKILLTVVTVFIFVLTSNAQQKYAYIYSEKVFKAQPEYNNAVAELDNYAKSAQQVSQTMLAEVKELFSDYQKTRSAMPESMRRAKEAEIVSKEKAANEYEEKTFGADGEISKRQKELFGPVEKRVLDVVNSIAATQGYDMIFDLSTVKSTIYQSPALDLTQTVIDMLKR